MHFLFSYLIFPVLATAANPIVSRTESRLPEGTPVATVRNGSYYGTHSDTYNQDFFLGIPFAEPPLEQLRFANPQSLDWAWTGVLPATNYAYVSLSSTDWGITHILRNALAMEGTRLDMTR